MNLRALLFTIGGVVVAIVFALEGFLVFRTEGFAPVLFAKVLICAIGVYVAWRNAAQLRKPSSTAHSDNDAKM